jgi:hypothetical protein
VAKTHSFAVTGPSGLRVVKDEHAIVRPADANSTATRPVIDAEQLRRGAPPRQKGREGKVSITQWVDPVVRKQIAQIALDEDRDQYELVNEALNLLFEKYGRSPIA